MTDLLEAGGTWLYVQCVTFVIHLASLFGVTYRDANALLFFVLWPALTLCLLGWVVWNAVVLASATSEQHRKPIS